MVRMAYKKTEESDSRKEIDSASDDDSSNLSSSDSVMDQEPEADASPKKQKFADEDLDGDYEDKMKSDAEDLSDSASHRHSKRKPSKSRIKRIVHEQSPTKTASGASTPGGAFPLPPINSLVMSPQSSVMTQASMVPSLSSSFLQMSPGQQRSHSGYKCDICGKVFRVPSRYESHMQNHSKGKPFCCDVCGKLFASQLKLDIHKPVHGRDRREAYDCPQCGHKCTSWRAYLYHVSKHTGNGGKKHTCEVCGRQFFAAQRLRNHMQSHMDGKNFCCLKCGKLFESQKRLDTHSLIHDSERKDPFTCVDCGKVYDDWRAFKQHMKTHGSDGVVYTCEICASQFYTQYEKEKHMKVHSADQRHQCPNCSKSFWTQSQLAVHMRNKHRNSKSHECVLCGRECARASGLKQHMKMHAGDDDFFCHLCGRTFQNGTDLASHSSVHTKDRPFTCDQCGKSFAKKLHYHRHMLGHAAGSQYWCGVCSKQFEHSLALATHMRTHAVDSQHQFACLACSFTAPSSMDLEAHAHTHGKEPPYVCGLCGRLFAEQRYFRQHMKRHIARAQKKKLQTHLSLPLSEALMKKEDSGSVEPSGKGDHHCHGKGDHHCHMCGMGFEKEQSLLAHIEEHKQSGLQMYLNIMGKGGKHAPGKASYRQQKGRDGHGNRSHSGSDSEGSDKTAAHQSKTTIHFGMQAQDFQSSAPKSSSSNGIHTQASEHAMAVRMQPFPGAPLSGSGGNTMASGPSVSITPHSGDGMEAFSGQPASFYSAPVFPEQSGSYATPYHAAAQQFQQQQPPENYTNGGLEAGAAMDYSGQYALPAKRLPDFANFSRQLALSNKPGFPYYPEAVSAAGQGSSALSHSSPMAGGYSFPEGLSPSPSFGPSSGKPMPPSDEAPTSMPVFPSMSSYSPMPPPGPGSIVAGRGDGSQPMQFESMFQFQPLGN